MEQIPFPNKKYQIIYADPPWSFNFQKRKLKNKDHLYPTMQAKEIINLPVQSITDDNCILFLWVMNSELQLALDCIKAWGFEYKTVAFTWVKKGKLSFILVVEIGLEAIQNSVYLQRKGV